MFPRRKRWAPGGRADYAALLGLGIAEEHLGQLAQALQHLESACKIAPGSAACQRELTTVKQKIK